MAPLPPPSFDSFPDLEKETKSTLKPKPRPRSPSYPPPSFNSFPSIDPPKDLISRPTKRFKSSTSSNNFLNGLESELNSKGKELESINGGGGSSSGSSSRRRRERGDDELESDSTRNSKVKGRRREKEEGRDDSDRYKKRDDSSRSYKEKDVKSSKRSEEKGKERERERERFGERDRDFGEPVKRPWKLVAEDKTTTTTTTISTNNRSPSPEPTEERIFYSDEKGDKLNVRYGGLDKSKVPRYRRLGAGRVVGFNSGLRITNETAYTGRGLEVGPLAQYRTPRYSDSRSANHLSNKHSKRIIIATRKPSFILGESTNSESQLDLVQEEDPFLSSSLDPTDFVPFQPIQSIASKFDNLEYEEGQDYRSISGLIKPSDLVSDSDEEGVDDIFTTLGIEGGESQSRYLAGRNIELDRELRSNPLQVEKWIEFVEFQDEVAQLSFGTGNNRSGGGGSKRALSVQERTSTSEIKLSILDRALVVPGNEKSEILLLAYLKAASEVWDPKKVLLRWGETLRSYPTLTGLWIEYVSWRQTNWATFGVREVVEVFEDSFKVLIEAMEKERIESEGRESLEGNAIYLFLRCCLMLRQAGFSERALASFQGIIELNFFRSESNQRQAPFESEPLWRRRILGELEEFWDSEVPRVGEPNALGWCNSSTDSDPPLPLPSTPNPLPSLASDNPFEQWAATEFSTSHLNTLPARTTDPGIDDDIDPFRVVLFDDIKDFLFVIHSPESKSQLAYAFFTFLGLPFIPPDCSTSNPFTTDSFIHSELVERPLARERFWPKEEVMEIPFDTIQGEAMEPERKSALKEPFETPFCSTPVSVELLFSSKSKWFSTLKKEDLQHVNCDFVRNVFLLLRPIIPPDGFFTLNYFSFEAIQNPKNGIKLAKQILKLPENRQNLSLWDGYARIERQRGKIEEARNVYVTALSMYRSFTKEDQVDGPLLWRAWSEMEWEEGRSILALKILVASTIQEEVDLAGLAKGEDIRPSSAKILRVRQFNITQLEAAFQPNISQGILRNRNHLAYSSALFEYISEGIQPAAEVFERHLFRLDCAGASGSAEHEEAYMSYVKLLYRHTEGGGPYRPSQLRDVLERAIKDFPNNSLFLCVFYYNELRMKIQNRVRRTLESSVLSKSVTSNGWLFAIFAELHLDARSQNLWSVRNLFDRAIENPRTRTSASIWILYIDYEIRNKDLGRAKSLLYRALREIPWCKELYLKPFAPPLSTMYKSTELKEMHSLLLEKGLRVREELEIGGWTSDVEILLDESDGDEDVVVKDVENLYSERQRLKPY